MREAGVVKITAWPGYGITTRKDLNLCWLLCINKKRVQLSFESCRVYIPLLLSMELTINGTLQHEMTLFCKFKLLWNQTALPKYLVNVANDPWYVSHTELIKKVS